MKLKTLLITTIGAFAFAGANAGDYTIPNLDTKSVIPAETGGLSGELSAGYDNRYIFRGLWFGNDTVWTNFSVSNQIAPNLTWSANAFYTDVMNNSLAYSEGNIGSTLAYDTSVGTFTLGYLYYQFFDGFSGNNVGQSDASELNLGYSREIFGGLTFSLLAANDFRIDAQYFEAGLSKSWTLTDRIGLDASAALGYGLNDYYSRLGGDSADSITHGLLSLGVPIALADNAVIRPHASLNISGDGRSNSNAAAIGDNAFFYGVSVAIGF